MAPTLLAAFVIERPQPLPLVRFRPGMVISRSVRVVGGEVLAPHADESGRTAALTIRGDGITVDLSGLTLRGTPATAWPDQRKGTGIRVTGRGVTIRGAKVHGYKIGLIADGVQDFRLVNSDFSYNWKQRLRSTLEKEDLSDWMSFHRNENDEWLRFGAGIYLRRALRAQIDNVRVVGGQCGLMMTDSEYAYVKNSNFSFLSAVGIGMYRTSNTVVGHNRIDWCVRGYSHGVYNRGQDSTGILVYEQSNRNVFAYNSVTHGGDGFFLWAGQTTMDTGQGGCNDNILYGNDFSHAPTNGIEATFSRNVFVNNLLMENWHGVWGGYSYDSVIQGNVFAYNGKAIAIEHGQSNAIRDNLFVRDVVGIYLWQNASQDPDWGYPKHRDTRSRDYEISGNRFVNTAQIATDFRSTRGIRMFDNGWHRVTRSLRAQNTPDLRLGEIKMGHRTVERTETPGQITTRTETDILRFGPTFVRGEGTTMELGGMESEPAVMQRNGNVILGYDPAEYRQRFRTNWNPLRNQVGDRIYVGHDPSGQNRLAITEATWQQRITPFPGGTDPFLKGNQLRGRRYILVDEWGPYDFQRPLLWPRANPKLKATEREFEVLGPAGTWRLVRAAAGLKLSQTKGKMGDLIRVDTSGFRDQELFFDLEYRGAATTDVRGVVTPAGRRVPFGFRKFDLPIDWRVSFWNYDAAKDDPRKAGSGYAAIRSKKPDATWAGRELAFNWYGSPVPGINADYFTTLAEGSFAISRPGEYELEITSDDGVRVSLDGKTVFEDWTYHGPKTDFVRVRLGGAHRLKVEHFELNGFSTLQVKVRPAR